MTIPKIPGSGINLDLKLGYLKKKTKNSNKIKNNVRKASVLWNVGDSNVKLSTAIISCSSLSPEESAMFSYIQSEGLNLWEPATVP